MIPPVDIRSSGAARGTLFAQQGRQMQTVTRRALIMLVALLAGCNRAPSRADTIEAIRRSSPALDTTQVYHRIWQDGPPWFSCAEVLAKVGTNADSAVVRGPVGNWKSLVVTGWVVLKDSSKGPVSDPGWCTMKLTDEGARRAFAWTPAPGPLFPTGAPRRGWIVPVGQRQIALVGSPRPTGRDSAAAEFIVTIRPNENGFGTGAARDTTRYVAALRRSDDRWRVVETRPSSQR
jgi:hypothetical protein